MNKNTLNILTYNIYYKSMLGLDKNFLPKEEAHKNVKKTIKDNSKGNFIIALQEVQALDKILPNNISKTNLIISKSGEETLVTIWSKNFKLIKTRISKFSDGRPIQLTLLADKDYILLIVNIHAAHQNQNFGRYLGKLQLDNEEYSIEMVRIIEEKINKFLNGVDKDIDRIIILGDFNEFYRNSDKYSFLIDVKTNLYTMTSDKNKIISCCYPKDYHVPCDYIFDSKDKVSLKIDNKRQPASDHYPVKTQLNL